MQEGIFTIRNRLGLHARAAAMFVKAAAKFNSIVTLVIEADGKDEEAAIEALGALIRSGFGEETPDRGG